jgi:hypothetical protein
MKTVIVGISSVLMFATVFAEAQTDVTAEDRDEIQSLTVRYSRALGSCDGEAFADLFESESGYFASGFRGRVEGRERLIALVRSERHCLPARAQDTGGRAGGTSAPAISLEIGSGGIFGTIDLGAVGQYQDRYVRTPAGWRFASRTVLTPDETAAGLDARQMSAVRELSSELPVGDHYEIDENGMERFLSSGVVIRVEFGTVGGRVYLDDGSYYDDVYEQAAPGIWRIRSRELVRAAAD